MSHSSDTAEDSNENMELMDISAHAKIDVEDSDDMHDRTPFVKQWDSVLADGWHSYLRKSLSELFLSSWMNILLLAMPLAFFAVIFDWGDAAIFVFSLMALCPLAERISFVTEELAKYTNDTLGGLLNATMGNVTEVIVSIFALKEGLLRVVQVSLIGSVLSNLLLVLGCSFFVGGLRHHTQRFNKSAATTNSGLLLLSLLGISFPMILHVTHEERKDNSSELALSRVTGISLLLMYGLLIVYQLKTHRSLFEGEQEGDDDDDEPPVLGWYGALFWSAIITFFISVLSEFIVNAIEGAAEELDVPILFIGAILLPIVGNAAEHAAAVIFAYRNKMDIALGIAVGSAAQISLFVIPLMVVVAWIIDQPLSLDFHVFETACMFSTVLVVAFAITNGQSDWLKGVMLMMGYFLVACSFWVHADPPDMTGRYDEP